MDNRFRRDRSEMLERVQAGRAGLSPPVHCCRRKGRASGKAPAGRHGFSERSLSKSGSIQIRLQLVFATHGNNVNALA